MSRRKKIAVSAIVCGCGALLLIVAAVVFAPHIADGALVKERLITTLKRSTGADIDYKHLRLDLLPHPHVTLEQVEISIPPGVEATALSLTIHPTILPLLRGRLQLAAVRLESSELQWRLQTTAATDTPPPQLVSVYDMGERVASFLASLPEFTIPDLDFRLVDSRLKLFDSEQLILSLEGVNTHMSGPPAGRTFTMDCHSSLWHHLSMNGRVNTKTYSGSGQIQVTSAQPRELIDYVLPETPFQVVDAPVDLSIDWRTGTHGELQATLRGAGGKLLFRNAEQSVSLQDTRIDATLHIDKDATTLSLRELSASEPELTISGTLTVGKTSPRLDLHLDGSRIDIGATRRTAMVLSGENEIVTQLFTVLKTGRISSISVDTQGDTLDELSNRGNLKIEGRLRDADLHIPTIPLDLTETSGEVVIAGGVLTGTAITTRLGQSTGENGQLRLGLFDETVPFHLETDVQADLSQLPPILGRLVDDPDVLKQLALLTEVKGAAQGKLLIDSDQQGMRVMVSANDIHLTAGYGNLPHRVQVDAEHITYDDRRIEVRQLSARMGASSFSEVNSSVDFHPSGALEFSCGSSQILPTDIFPHLSLTGMTIPLKIHALSLAGQVDDIRVTSADLSWNDSEVTIAGSVKPHSEGFMRLDQDIAAGIIDVAQMRRALTQSNGTIGHKTVMAPSSWPVRGLIRFTADQVKIGRFINPLEADIEFDGQTIVITVKESDICGIMVSATARASAHTVAVDLDAAAQQRQLQTTLQCLAIQSVKADGIYRLDATFSGSGKIGELLDTGTGRVKFEVPEGGHIYHDFLLLKVLKFINTLEIFKDDISVGQMESDGFDYQLLQIDAALQNGKLHYQEALLQGRAMNITARGEHDLDSGLMDMSMLVAPVVVLNTILSHVPLIGHSLDKLDTIPLRAEGTVDDLHIYPLAPKALDYQLKETMEGLIKGKINILDGGGSSVQ
jgi:hypothetical protein